MTYIYAYFLLNALIFYLFWIRLIFYSWFIQISAQINQAQNINQIQVKRNRRIRAKNKHISQPQ